MKHESWKEIDAEFLNINEVAALLKVSPSWVYGHLRSRCKDPLPAYRLGKYWRFRADEVLAWVKKHVNGA